MTTIKKWDFPYSYDASNPEHRKCLALLLLKHGFRDVTWQVYKREKREYVFSEYHEKKTKFYFRKGRNVEVIFDWGHFIISNRNPPYGFANETIHIWQLHISTGVFFFLQDIEYEEKPNNLIGKGKSFPRKAVIIGYDGWARNYYGYHHTLKENDYVIYFNLVDVDNHHPRTCCMNWEFPKIFKIPRWNYTQSEPQTLTSNPQPYDKLP